MRSYEWKMLSWFEIEWFARERLYPDSIAMAIIFLYHSFERASLGRLRSPNFQEVLGQVPPNQHNSTQLSLCPKLVVVGPTKSTMEINWAGMYKSNRMNAEQHLFEVNQPSESERKRMRDGDFNGRSGSNNLKGVSYNDQDIHQPPQKKRNHRHTQDQIQVMEDFFKDYPHPDDRQRKELGRQLGLEPLQVKFWFQTSAPK
ncbi:homeobox-leucine zipper protein PROTODERMAL FACTOR 2-like [Tasmannia lanceolata]|uniref:homeobox-leucine zipper protein PROTODERMAL FACTOR 2-like n=1 Tax=Tasmannia lanceolata TaxID=3420 RepID=UPI004063BB27